MQPDKEGNTYQWQVDIGNGFVDISNNSSYAGANNYNLEIKNIPSSWYGYQYRCVVDGKVSSIQFLKFVATWTGNFNKIWENPANWKCGQLPDENTDVIISSGSVVTINANTTIRSLTIKPGGNLSVAPGYHLTITH